MVAPLYFFHRGLAVVAAVACNCGCGVGHALRGGMTTADTDEVECAAELEFTQRQSAFMSMVISIGVGVVAVLMLSEGEVVQRQELLEQLPDATGTDVAVFSWLISSCTMRRTSVSGTGSTPKFDAFGSRACEQR